MTYNIVSDRWMFIKIKEFRLVFLYGTRFQIINKLLHLTYPIKVDFLFFENCWFLLKMLKMSQFFMLPFIPFKTTVVDH